MKDLHGEEPHSPEDFSLWLVSIIKTMSSIDKIGISYKYMHTYAHVLFYSFKVVYKCAHTKHACIHTLMR